VGLRLTVMKSSVSGAYQPSEPLEQFAYVVTGAGHRHGFTATQWTAMVFFGRANRFSRTVSSFAEFHAMTSGAASQTIRRLVDRGFLHPPVGDRRKKQQARLDRCWKEGTHG